jgi:hypothetical protein
MRFFDVGAMRHLPPAERISGEMARFTVFQNTKAGQLSATGLLKAESMRNLR